MKNLQTLQNKTLFFLQKYDNWIVALIGLVLALILRLLLRGYVSGDTLTGFIPWYEYIEQKGGIDALGHAFSGYPPLYLYMLVASYYLNQLLHLSSLAAIKIIPIAFDFLAAFWVFKIVQVKYPGKTVGVLAALVFLFLPTIFINGAMWGQIDGVFTAFVLGAFYYLLKRRDLLAMLAFGLAISIKFQAIFLAPFLLILVLLGRLSLRSLLLVPGVYFITLLPAWALGRPLGDLLLLYVKQVDSFDQLTLNAPTFYALIDNSVNYLFGTGGVLIAAALVMAAVFGVYKLKPRLTPDLMVGLAATSLILLPYLLPKMHERYFYPAEVFFLLAAFYRPRLALVAVALQITALLTFNPYFFGITILPLAITSLIMLAVLVYACYDLAHQLAGSLVPEPDRPAE